MPGIIEIWRSVQGVNIPVRFAVGEPPSVLDAEGALDAIVGPNVKSIKFYETGAIGGKAFRGSCFVVQFEESAVRRIIPAAVVVDVAYEVPENNGNKDGVPQLES